MFQFENPDLLMLLILPVIGMFLFFFFRKKKNGMFSRIGRVDTINRLFYVKPDSRSIFKMVLFIGGMLLLIIALVNPQWGTKRKTETRKGIDIIIALDVSSSMLAMDVLPNRLERAKKMISDLIGNIRGNRIGLIVFAGNAYLQVPLTTDYSALDLTLSGIQTDLIPTQGTQIGQVFELANQSFDQDGKKNSALVIVTDGENHDDNALEQAQYWGRQGVKIFAIGVGTDEGAYIPTFYRGLQDYKRDENGVPVLSRLNKKMVEDLAVAGSGSFFLLSGNRDNQIIENIANQLEAIEKSEFESIVFTEFESYFQVFTFFSFLLLFIEFLLSRGKKEAL
jgi:Ca-activated chloride channel homolog